jgi:hypothetical protein
MKLVVYERFGRESDFSAAAASWVPRFIDEATFFWFEAGQTGKRTADFSTAAASAPPSVEMMVLWVWVERTSNRNNKGEMRGLSTAAAKAPPPVEMTNVWVGLGENGQRQKQIPHSTSLRAGSSG